MKNLLLSLATILSFCCFNVVTAQDCVDTDNGATDSYGDGCAAYNSFPSWCDGYDDDDFVSGEMCCICGGGEVAASTSDVTLTLFDSYGDGGGSVTIDGTTYTLDTGSENSWTLSVDLSACTDVVYAATDSWSSENSWSVSDADGNVLVSMGNASGSFGSCGTPGCMDANADNYNADAAVEDGSCTYSCPFIAGGVDYTTSSCYMYVTSYGYTVDEMIGYGYDCSCMVQGCTDATACNYSADANIEGSCDYSCLCDGVPVSCDGGTWQSEVSWEIVGCNGVVALSGGAPFTECVDVYDIPDVYTINMYDAYGDGWNGNVLTIGDATYDVTTNGDGAFASVQVGGDCPIVGCMDPAATNYNPDAVEEDGSCEYVVYGCMDGNACNFKML